MRLGGGRFIRTAAFTALAALPFIIHLALLNQRSRPVAVVTTIITLLPITYLVLARSSLQRRRLVAGLLWVAAALALWRSPGQSLVAVAGLVHGFVNLGLLAIFGSSLRRGREPLVTAIARRIRGPLNAELEAYTRGVTLAWCCFFAGQIVISLVLLAAAPITVWSMFVNVLNFPLIAAMFIAEYAFRPARFRGGANDKPTDIFRIMAQLRANFANRAA